MKHLLLTTIAAVLLVGCGESQQSVPQAEAKPAEPVAETAKPEPPTDKTPAVSIYDAARDGNIEAVKQHIAAGTDLNAKDNFGKTTLRLAAVGGHKEVAELLIAAGADMNAKADDSLTPLDWAISQKHPENCRPPLYTRRHQRVDPALTSNSFHTSAIRPAMSTVAVRNR